MSLWARCSLFSASAPHVGECRDTSLTKRGGFPWRKCTRTHTCCFCHWLWGPGSSTYLLALEDPIVGWASHRLCGTCPGVPDLMQMLSQPRCPAIITRVPHCPVPGKSRLCRCCSLLPLGPLGLGTFSVGFHASSQLYSPPRTLVQFILFPTPSSPVWTHIPGVTGPVPAYPPRSHWFGAAICKCQLMLNRPSTRPSEHRGGQLGDCPVLTHPVSLSAPSPPGSHTPRVWWRAHCGHSTG